MFSKNVQTTVAALDAMEQLSRPTKAPRKSKATSSAGGEVVCTPCGDGKAKEIKVVPPCNDWRACIGCKKLDTSADPQNPSITRLWCDGKRSPITGKNVGAKCFYCKRLYEAFDHRRRCREIAQTRVLNQHG